MFFGSEKPRRTGRRERGTNFIDGFIYGALKITFIINIIVATVVNDVVIVSAGFGDTCSESPVPLSARKQPQPARRFRARE